VPLARSRSDRARALLGSPPARRLARPVVSRLGAGFGVRRHGEGLLQGRGGSMHNARTYDGMPLELYGQSFQEGIAL
jgi:hypothetical protein